MFIELSKSQRKIARQIIEVGLQREFQNGILKMDTVIEKWKTGELDNRDAYHEMYQKLKNHDKHIGRRYDGMTGSRYLLIVLQQLADEIISLDEISDFNDEVKAAIYKWVELNKE